MLVILHNIRSLHNVGSIFRTADAVGVEKIYLSGITPAPVDEFGRTRSQLTKVSLGAEKYVRWEKVSSTSRLVTKLKKEDYVFFAVEQSKKAIPYYKIFSNSTIRRSSDSRIRVRGKRVYLDKFAKVILVLGSETRGLPQSILKKCDKVLEIPMRGKKESLNVAVAFGIVAYHLVKLSLTRGWPRN